VSSVDEIRAAIEKLNAEDRALLLEELHITQIGPPENDPVVLAAIDEGIADCRAGRVHSLEEVQEMMKPWISGSPSP
jgi:hypothetical protein